jgi:hypothetical protein
MTAFFSGKGGSNLARRATFGLLAPSKSPHSHVVLHHGAFLQFVPDGLSVIRTGCFEKLLKVINGCRARCLKSRSS